MSGASRAAIIGLLISAAGAVCFSTKAILVKLAYRDTQVDAVSLLALRMVFALPFFAFSAFRIFLRRNERQLNSRDILWIAFTGCLGYYISSLLDFAGLQYVSAALERLVLFIYPTLVLIMGAAWFKHRITRVQWAAVALTYFGILLAFLGEWKEGSPETTTGVLLVFGCALTYGSYIVISSRLINVAGSTRFNSYSMVFASLGVLLHHLFSGAPSLMGLEPAVYGYGFLMGVISTVIPSYLVAESIKRIGPGNTAIVASIGPVATLFMAWFFLNESISLWQLAGTGCILGGIQLIARFGPNRSASELQNS